ncbi:surface protein/Bartonella adhesin [Bartonella grahamii as4aup]|uniref:Surface protein/Bartonella adhesin n=2 Tax=Bartonella grahamii TaxID=33045 RepID=C6ABG2_BARGA|nr:Vomp family autotransporter [Bartonella grahamii]ACS50529.1 surface protein/Bartonella adhesin [Bartonella grahamii as4aup]
MKKYSTSNSIKVVSLGTVIATLLSSVSPVVAANLAITGDKVQSSSGPSVSYQYASHGSIVLAGDNDNCGVFNVVDRGGSNQGTDKQITAEELYERVSTNKEINGKRPFNWAKDQLNWGGDGLTATGAYMGKATGGLSNVMPEAYGVFSFATGCGSSATGHYSTAFGAGATAKRGGAQAFGIGALAGEQASIAIGVASEAVASNTIAIGGLAKAKGVDSIAFGNKSLADGQQAIAIGYGAQAQTDLSIAIGLDARATEREGVALGSESIADVAAGAIGYDPYIKGPSQSDNFAWKSTLAAVSVGDVKSEKTRQIVGVAAGTELHDAVNVAQLKTLQSYVDQGWTLSVGGENAKAVGIKDTVDLSAASDNLKITKGAENNNVQFDLAKNITVASVTAGNASMSNDGIMFADGARITVDGIDAGNKKITGVANGEESDDAVNFAQLQEIKNQIEGNSFVKQDGGEEGRITIGMATGGAEINVANKSGEDRTISGVKAAVNNNDAVNKQQLDGQIADVVDTIKSNSLVKREEETNRITIGKNIEGTEINIANKSGDARTISGVKEAVNDDEAVNKKQLDGEIADITDSIKVIKEANSFAVLYDKNADGTINYNSVTLGGDKTTAPVALHNVQDGAISQDSHDAINGSQIEKIYRSVAAIFGGDADFHDGILFGPHYHLSQISENGVAVNKDHFDVGSALTGLDDNINNVNSRLTHVANEFTQKIEGVSKDSLLWSKEEEAFVAQHGEGKTNSKIKFLANGDISEDSTDAVNGSQLFETNQTVANTNQTVVNLVTAFNGANKNISSYLGGGADVVANKAPTYTIQNTEYHDVGSAFSSVNNSITNIQNQITDATKNSLVKQEGDAGRITIGMATGGTEINVANKSGDARIISGVKAAVANNEAVNKEQLDKSIEKISKDINLTTAAAVLYDKENGAVNYGSITLGGDKNKEPVALLNVKAGTIAKNSHDAINGSQIEKISGDIANYFGGDASFENGNFKGPQYNLSTVSADGEVVQKIFTDVGSALSGLDANVKNVNTHLTNVTNDFTQQINNITQEVKGDALLWSNDEKAFVAQHGEGKTNSKIKFLANGDISANSTDAVNGSQLFTTNQNIATVTNNLTTISQNISKYFGGGADVSNGKAPTYTIQGKSHNDFESAFSTVDNSITNIQNQITNATKNSLVKQEGDADTITVGKATGGTEINVANKSGGARTISGVKAAVNNDEAVNKEQLDGRIADISNSINNIREGSAFAVLYDKNANGTVNYNSVSLGGNKSQGPVALLNVKDGKIAEDSTDAVNGDQINKISQDIANYFGGDAEFVDGDFWGPEYNLSTVSANGKVVQKTFENVGDALSGLDANVKNVNDHLTNVTNDFTQKINNITQEVKGDALLWSNDEQAFVAQHGEERTNSKIKFLANGDISANSTDAVNGSQLYLMSNQLATYFGGGAGYNNGQWTAPTFKIAQFNNDGSSGEKKTYHDVAGAFDGVSESMSKINNRIQNVENNVSSNGLNWNEQKKAYDASHDGQPSKIINVADGKIVEGSKDAVNGGQLWETNERVTGVEKDVKHLTNRVDNISTTVTDMGETVFHIENRVDNIENTVNNLSDGAVNYDKDADGKKTNKITLKGGNESEPVMIDNVAAGRIEQGSKEAVNGGQLHDYTEQQMKIILDETKHYTDQRVNNIVINAIDDAVDRANQYTDMKFNILSYDIKSVRKEARQAAAVGLAVSNLRYFDEPGSLSVSFGSGAWRGQSAFALGAGYTSENGKIRSNLSATSAGGHWGIGGAITLKIK